MAYFKVLQDEPINGVTAGEALKYGIVSTAEHAYKRGHIFIRMSKFMLRIIIESEGILQEVLFGPASETAALAETFPQGVTLEDIFLTCREYKNKTQEVVQLISLLVTHLTLLLVERDRPSLTLDNLRPGAMVFGEKRLACQRLEALTLVAQLSVQQAGDAAFMRPGAPTDKMNAKTEARHKEALKHAIILVAMNDTVGQLNTAALFEKINFPAFDMWACFCTAVYLGQCKGTENPLNPREVKPAEAMEWVTKMQNVAIGKLANGNEPTTKHPAPLILPAGMQPLCFELLVARPASRDFYSIMAEQGSGWSTCVVVITQDQLKRALGPIFGGIAARCEEKLVAQDGLEGGAAGSGAQRLQRRTVDVGAATAGTKRRSGRTSRPDGGKRPK